MALALSLPHSSPVDCNSEETRQASLTGSGHNGESRAQEERLETKCRWMRGHRVNSSASTETLIPGESGAHICAESDDLLSSRVIGWAYFKALSEFLRSICFLIGFAPHVVSGFSRIRSIMSSGLDIFKMLFGISRRVPKANT